MAPAAESALLRGGNGEVRGGSRGGLWAAAAETKAGSRRLLRPLAARRRGQRPPRLPGGRGGGGRRDNGEAPSPAGSNRPGRCEEGGREGGPVPPALRRRRGPPAAWPGQPPARPQPGPQQGRAGSYLCAHSPLSHRRGSAAAAAAAASASSSSPAAAPTHTTRPSRAELRRAGSGRDGTSSGPPRRRSATARPFPSPSLPFLLPARPPAFLPRPAPAAGPGRPSALVKPLS